MTKQTDPRLQPIPETYLTPEEILEAESKKSHQGVIVLSFGADQVVRLRASRLDLRDLNDAATFLRVRVDALYAQKQEVTRD